MVGPEGSHVGAPQINLAKGFLGVRLHSLARLTKTAEVSLDLVLQFVLPGHQVVGSAPETTHKCNQKHISALQSSNSLLNSALSEVTRPSLVRLGFVVLAFASPLGYLLTRSRLQVLPASLLGRHWVGNPVPDVRRHF